MSHRSAALVLASIVILVTSACQRGPEATGAPDKKADSDAPAYLFVQNADGVEIGDGTLTLKSVSPTTVYFTDRPDRSAGHGHTTDFIEMWGEGPDSFSSNPPNAALSILDADGGDIVVTLSNPRLDGEDLTYDIKSIEGVLPEKGGAAALFIDVLVARRPLGVYRPRAVVVR